MYKNMKQINKVKATSALLIHSHDIIFKKEMGKIKASEDLFNNIYDTFSNAQKNIFKYEVNNFKQILIIMQKKIIRGRNLSKVQREQLNETKANVNKLHAYLTKKNKAYANKKNLHKPKLIKTPKDLLNNVNNTLSNIQKNHVQNKKLQI